MVGFTLHTLHRTAKLRREHFVAGEVRYTSRGFPLKLLLSPYYDPLYPTLLRATEPSSQRGDAIIAL